MHTRNVYLSAIPTPPTPHPLQVKDDEASKLEGFWSINSYVKGSYTEREAFENLNREMLKIEESMAGNRLFYLALPPSVFASVTSNIKACCMSSTYVVRVPWVSPKGERNLPTKDNPRVHLCIMKVVPFEALQAL